MRTACGLHRQEATQSSLSPCLAKQSVLLHLASVTFTPGWGDWLRLDL